MLAMTYRGPYRVRVEQKPTPRIEHPRDAIVRVTRACICGSDIHLYHGLIPDTRVGHTFGHEFVGVIDEVGSEVIRHKVGDRVLVPFNVFCKLRDGRITTLRLFPHSHKNDVVQVPFKGF